MAGERRGKAVEGIIRYATEGLRGQLFPKDAELVWDQQVDSLKWKPDIFVLPCENFSGLLILITFSGSETHSKEKFWRNMAEYFDARIHYPNLKAISIIAGARLREKQLEAQKHAFDNLILFEQYASKQKIYEWLVELSCEGNNQEKLLKKARELSNADKEFFDFVEHVKQEICSVFERDSIHSSFWHINLKQESQSSGRANLTCFRRGIAKSILFTSDELDYFKEGNQIPKLSRHNALIREKILGRSITGLKLADAEIKFVVESIPNLHDVINYGITKVGVSCRERLWNLGEIEQALYWCSEHWEVLTDPHQLSLKLSSKFEEPSQFHIYRAVKTILDLRLGRQGQEWIEDVVDATGEMRSILVGLIFPDFEAGKSNLSIPILNAVSKAFSKRIQSIKPLEKRDISKAIEAYIHKEIETRLVCHGIDGVGAIIRLTLLDNEIPYQDKYFLPSALSEKLGYSTRDLGTKGILIANQIYVHWKSVSEEGRNHKVKEMYARIFQSTRTWNYHNYVTRESPGTFFLIVDGTWQDDDLISLIKAGWSKIFYPSEMQEFVDAIREVLGGESLKAI